MKKKNETRFPSATLSKKKKIPLVSFFFFIKSLKRMLALGRSLNRLSLVATPRVASGKKRKEQDLI